MRFYYYLDNRSEIHVVDHKLARWELDVRTGGERTVTYLGYEEKYLINGEKDEI